MQATIDVSPPEEDEMAEVTTAESVDTTPSFSLTDQQRAFFDAFGFVALRGLFAPEMDRIIRGFEEVFADEGYPRMETHEHLHLNERRVIIPAVVSRSPDLEWLLEDPRTIGVVRSLIGDDYEYAQSDGNLFFCESSWHSDLYEAPIEQFHIKMSFYLDPLNSESGAIRLIPGTNHWDTPYAEGLRRDLDDHSKVEDLLGVDHRDVPSWTVESTPGDVIVWNFRTIHASFNGGERRRLFSLNWREPGPDATA